jgi:hypothetical protein
MESKKSFGKKSSFLPALTLYALGRDLEPKIDVKVWEEDYTHFYNNLIMDNV